MEPEEAGSGEVALLREMYTKGEISRTPTGIYIIPSQEWLDQMGQDLVIRIIDDEYVKELLAAGELARKEGRAVAMLRNGSMVVLSRARKLEDSGGPEAKTICVRKSTGYWDEEAGHGA